MEFCGISIIVSFAAVALISIYAGENLENLSFGNSCEIIDYQPLPGADLNGDEEYERYSIKKYFNPYTLNNHIVKLKTPTFYFVLFQEAGFCCNGKHSLWNR